MIKGDQDDQDPVLSEESPTDLHTKYRQLKTGEVEPDYGQHKGNTMNRLDFNILIKKNPFDEDLRSMERRGIIVPKHKTPEKAIPEFKRVFEAEIISQNSAPDVTKTTDVESTKLPMLKNSESSDGKMERPRSASNEKGTLQRSQSVKPVKSILKVGNKSKFSQGYRHSGEWDSGELNFSPQKILQGSNSFGVESTESKTIERKKSSSFKAGVKKK